MSRNLVVHYKRVSYLVEPTPEALKVGRGKVQIREWQDGRVEIRRGVLTLPYSTVEKEPHVSSGDIVENKRLGAVLATIQAAQAKRDEARLASPKMTVAQKERLRARRQSAAGVASVPETQRGRRGRPPNVSRPDRITVAGLDPTGPVQAFFDRFAIEQAERRRRQNASGNDRKRAREFEAAKARGSTP